MSMLLWVHLFIHEVTGEIVTVIDLQLQERITCQALFYSGSGILVFHSLCVLYLFGDINLQLIFHRVYEGVFAAGVQHPLSDAAFVSRHGVYKHCKGTQYMTGMKHGH